jgi:hypothetical protein
MKAVWSLHAMQLPIAESLSSTRWITWGEASQPIGELRAYPAVRPVRGALGASHPAPPVRTLRGRLVRAACARAAEALGRTCQLSVVTTPSGRELRRWRSS